MLLSFHSTQDLDGAALPLPHKPELVRIVTQAWGQYPVQGKQWSIHRADGSDVWDSEALASPKCCFCFPGVHSQDRQHCLRTKGPGQGEAPRQMHMELPADPSLGQNWSDQHGRQQLGSGRPTSSAWHPPATGRMLQWLSRGEVFTAAAMQTHDGFLPKRIKHSELESEMPSRGSQG